MGGCARVMGASGGPRIISSVLTTAFRCRPDLSPHPCARPALLPCRAALGAATEASRGHPARSILSYELPVIDYVLQEVSDPKAQAQAAWGVALLCAPHFDVACSDSEPMPAGRLVELGEDLLAAVAAPRVHDQVVPNATYIEHWRAGNASFMVSQQQIEVRGVQPACSMAALPET